MAEGAYSKAASSLSTEVAQLTEEEQRAWGTKLLPSSTRPAQALASPEAAPEAPADADATERQPYVLKGVRFRAMSAPGPSGARPEHLREMVAVRDRRIAAALLEALGRFADAASKGELCDASRWILESRLVFLRKKTGNAPRPIRVGELWRRVIAKRLVDAHRAEVQRICLGARQFGVAIPGGAEGLIHFRMSLEKHFALQDTCVAAVDVDLSNAFPRMEWDSIRAAVEDLLPNVAAWTHWCHTSPGRVLCFQGSTCWWIVV